MISAVVLLNTNSGSQDKVVENLKLVEGVEEAHALYGVYDLMVKMHALSLEKLKDVIRFRIKQGAGVTSSLTLMIVDN
jgi:DNA-binding Lrp family transcriptional regulator